MKAKKRGLIAGMCFVMPWLHAGPADNSEPIGPSTTPPTSDSRLDEIIKEKPPSEPAPFWASHWAGVYENAIYSTTMERLEVTATSVVYHSQGCFHNFTDRGRIVGVAKHGLCLVEDMPQESDGVGLGPFLDGELVFFRWEGEEFCAPRSQLIEWIHALNFQVGYGLDHNFGLAPLRKTGTVGSEQAWIPQKTPLLPADLHELILSNPLAISVVSVQPVAEPRQVLGTCDSGESEWHLLFNVNSGVAPPAGSGFTLQLNERTDKVPVIGVVEVVSIEGNQVTARLRAHGKPASLQVFAGARFDMPGSRFFKSQ